MTQQRIVDLLQYTLVQLQHALASLFQAATSEGMTILRILRVLNGFSTQTVDAVDVMDEIYYPSQPSLADLKMQLSLLNGNSPGCQPLIHLDPAWYWLKQVSLAPESNTWFLFGVLRGFIDNIVTNEALLRASGLRDEVIGAMRDIGAAVVKEMACLYAEDRLECRLGFTFVSECLRAQAAP